MSMNADTMSLWLNVFDAQAHFRDGMNLYQYQRGNPLGGMDPSGLDMFDDVDSAISDRVGNALYAIGMINESARYASIGLNTAISIAGGFLPGSGLYDAFQSVQVIAQGKGGFWDAMNVAMVAFPLAKGVGKLVGLSGLFKAKGYLARACNCFVAGTLVDTPDGQSPIEDLRPGDEVMTRDQNQPAAEPCCGRISRVFRNITPVILWLTLANGQTMGVTPGHEVWTQQDGWTFAGQLETGDLFVDPVGQPVEILDIRVDPTPTPIYNIEIDGTYTYFAEGVWVHNNSCAKAAKGIYAKHHVFAKFLGGDIDGILVQLKKSLHEEYHSGLRMRLTDSGIRPGNRPWAEYFQEFPEKQYEAMNVMMDYTRAFDAKNGTGLLSALWRQIASQMW